MNKTKLAEGKIIQAIGPIIDVQFPEGNSQSFDRFRIWVSKKEPLVVEVAQHIGDDVVRAVAMGPTDGIVRGMKVLNTGEPISVPVGKCTLGRMFDVLGRPIDNKGEIFPMNFISPFIVIHHLSKIRMSAMKFWRPELKFSI